jgi:hypothetical protein
VRNNRLVILIGVFLILNFALAGCNRTILNFRKLKKESSSVHAEMQEIAETNKDELIYEYYPLYEDILNYENDLLIDVVYEGNISLLDKGIDSKMLDCFNPAELRLLRNMIFAKYNYIFGSRYLRDYFSKFSWYEGTKSGAQENMTVIDWQNVSIIQGFEEKLSGYLDDSNLGENFSLEGQIGGFEYYESHEPYRTIVKKIKVDGEITAMFRGRTRTGSGAWDYEDIEIANAKIKDNQFNMELGRIRPDLMFREYISIVRAIIGNFNMELDTIPPNFIYSMDHQAKFVIPWFCILGTYTDQYDIEQSVYIRGFKEYGKGYNFRYYYMYVDRDNVIQSLTKGKENDVNGLNVIYPSAEVKNIISLHLKKGWNKIRCSVTYNGKYIIEKTESSPENGFYIIGRW